MLKLSLIVITDGRQDCLEQVLTSAYNRLGFDNFNQLLIINDDQTNKYQAWLAENYGSLFQVHQNKPKKGFGGAIQEAWKLINPDTDFVFHLEEDFLFNDSVPLGNMISVLNEYPDITQIVLKRQSVIKEESDYGGIVEKNPNAYTELTTPYGTLSTHREFYSTNPCLYRRSLLDVGWPDEQPSELRMTERLLENPDNKFAFWGKKFDPPFVEHIGHSRPEEGFGY